VNSADGMTFGVHRNRLAAHSIIFETAENFVTSGEPVRLSDTAATLELFFGCIYNQPVDPEELEIDEVLLLADTALKYESRLIFQLCKPEIRCAITWNVHSLQQLISNQFCYSRLSIQNIELGDEELGHGTCRSGRRSDAGTTR
jgi:hypothetical protein